MEIQVFQIPKIEIANDESNWGICHSRGVKICQAKIRKLKGGGGKRVVRWLGTRSQPRPSFLLCQYPRFAAHDECPCNEVSDKHSSGQSKLKQDDAESRLPRECPQSPVNLMQP